MAPKIPEDVDRMFEERVNAGDLEGALALYEPGAKLVSPDGEITDAAALPDTLGQMLAVQLRLNMKVTKVIRIGDDLAVLYNEWTGSTTGTNGQPTAMAGKAIEVVRQQADGTWRFIVDDPWARG
ncbi:MAG TPA: DUF4440 domain-containing protein [Candidatus Binatia bacterium]|nr:DUF4440 domain-containing protein [Candidatus Binatia bacterium]